MSRISRRTFLQHGCLGTAATLFSRRSFAWAGPKLDARLAADRLRPQYHLLPAANWMNDPNGPIFYRGRYHMFFQYNPNGAFWGSMHWAHASSSDMIHWRHEPVALAPTPGGYDRDGVFSGSAILHDERPTIIYTGVLPPASSSEITLADGQHKWREVQCLATSNDPDLRTWRKLPEPIIAHPPQHLLVTGFRDPSVWREGKKWLLTLGSGFRGKGGAVLLYESRDLLRWAYRHPLIEGVGSGQPATNPVDGGEMWECPDFFPLGDRHVLLYATQGKVWWKTGSFRNRRFTPDKEGVVDYGAYYAAKTMLDERGNRILWGWIPETRPESEYRAAGWAGLMSLPRALSIDADGSLRMRPAPRVEMLRTAHAEVHEGDRRKREALSAIRIRELAADIQARFAPGRPFRLRIRSENAEPFAEIEYDPKIRNAELRVNSAKAPLNTDGEITLRLLLDASVLEVFANERVALTVRVYSVPTSPLRIETPDLDVLTSLDVWGMKPISKNRLTGEPSPGR
jgi:beta-fructofuranosidase